MNKLSELEELQAYRRKIWEDADSNLQDGISRMHDTAALLRDLQELGDVLSETVRQQQEQLDDISGRNRELEDALRRQEEKGRRLQAQNEQFAALGLEAAQVSALTISLNERMRHLESEKAELEKVREEFAKQKAELKRRTREAEEHAERLKGERDQAIVVRDEAVAERNETFKKMRETEDSLADKSGEIELLKKKYIRDLENVRDQVRELEEQRIWYKEYAAALDRKVIGRYEEKSHELDSHYKDYLNNPDKWSEHREHFPEFQKDYVSSERKDTLENRSPEKEEKEEERKGYTAVSGQPDQIPQTPKKSRSVPKETD